MYTCFFLCIVAASTVLVSYQQTAQECEEGWFGPECQYKCRCQEACNAEGECPGQCDVSWFGYKCQYSLEKYTATTRQSQEDLTFTLNDNNQYTCVDIGDQAVVITFINICYRPWIRLHTQDPDLLYSLKITLLDKQNQSAVLTSKEGYIVQDEIVDIHISIANFFVRRIILDGEAIQRLCSLWIIKGQNVATKQRVYYSTSDIVGIDTALPQYPPATDESIICNTNDEWVAGTTWQVVLDTPFIIKQVDFYVNDTIGGSRYFKIKKFDSYNALYDVYVTPTGPSNNYYGAVFWYSTPTKAFTFRVTDLSTNKNQILMLCEVLAYTDCSEGHWGLQCQYPCNKSCPNMCRFDDGLCNDGCFGYSDPPRCSKPCEAGTWGLNCTKRCSNHCIYSSCDRVNGVCDKGCLGYSNPPDCTLVIMNSEGSSQQTTVTIAVSATTVIMNSEGSSQQTTVTIAVSATTGVLIAIILIIVLKIRGKFWCRKILGDYAFPTRSGIEQTELEPVENVDRDGNDNDITAQLGVVNESIISKDLTIVKTPH